MSAPETTGTEHEHDDSDIGVSVDVDALDWQCETGRPVKTNLRELLAAIADADEAGLKAVERLSVHETAKLADRYVRGMGRDRDGHPHRGVERARGEALAGYRTPENPRECVAEPPREWCRGPDRDGIPCFACFQENPERPPTAETAVSAEEAEMVETREISNEKAEEPDSDPVTPRVDGPKTVAQNSDPETPSKNSGYRSGYRDADEYVYVRARDFGDNRKKPVVAWVGECPDDIDPRTLDNPHTLSYDETDAETPYIIVGAVDGHVLDTDVDVGEDHKETFDGEISDIQTVDGALAFVSGSNGPHQLIKFERDHSGLDGVAGVDLQGDMDGKHGVVTSPFHHPEYDITAEPTERVCFDTVIENDDASLNNGFGIALLESETPAEATATASIADRVADGDYTPPEDAPDERPACYHAALMSRQTGGANCNNHDMNVCIGALGLGAGYSVETILEHIHSLDNDVVGFDKRETEYGLKHLRNGSYSPPATETLAEAGICGLGCEPTCPIHVPGIGDTKRSAKAPGDGDEYEQMPTWALRNVAYYAGHDPEDDVWRDAETGTALTDDPEDAGALDDAGIHVYRALPARIHNVALDILDDAGRGDEHGRSQRSVTDDLPVRGKRNQ